MNDSTTSTRPAAERYHDLLARMDDGRREECDLVVAELMLEVERRTEGTLRDRMDGIEALVDEHKSLVDDLVQVVTRLAAHLEACPGASADDLHDARELAARCALR